MTVCHTLKACRIALWVSFSPTLGVKLEMLQESENGTRVWFEMCHLVMLKARLNAAVVGYSRALSTMLMAAC